MGDKPAEREFLRFNVPIAPDDENDLSLFDRFGLIPNGLKQDVIKMALQRMLPALDDDAQWQALLAEALMVKSKSGRQRGRPRKSAAAKSAVVVTAPVPKELGVVQVTVGQEVAQVLQLAEHSVEPDVAQEVEVTEAQPVAAPPSEPEAKPTAAVVPPKADLSRFGGMIVGKKTWD